MQNVQIKMIVAYDNNQVIGSNNTIPWHLPEDLKRFKALTTDNVVIMGSNTQRSLPKFPLPNRFNIVLSKKQKAHREEDYAIVHHVIDVLDILKEKDKTGYVIGGEQIYKLFLPYCDEVLATEVHTEVDNGDTHFPTLSTRIWKAQILEKNYSKEGLGYQYVRYVRF